MSDVLDNSQIALAIRHLKSCRNAELDRAYRLSEARRYSSARKSMLVVFVQSRRQVSAARYRRKSETRITVSHSDVTHLSFALHGAPGPSLHAYTPTPRIGKRSFAGTTSEPRKSDTVRAVCKSNPEHGALASRPVQCPTPPAFASHLDVPPYPAPPLPANTSAGVRALV